MSASDNTLDEHDWGSAPDMFGPRHAYREALILRRLFPALPGPDVLNAGSGAGSLTLSMLDAGLSVTSADASPELCERVRHTLASHGHSAPVHTAPVEDLPLPDASFDAVVCAEVLEHLDDDRLGLDELARVARPGALLLVTVPADPYRFDWTDLWAGHRRRYTSAMLEERLRASGFHDVGVDGWGFPLSALYHRRVYRPALRRRLARGGGAGGAPPALVSALVRGALEVDSLFVGRERGALGLIATALRAP